MWRDEFLILEENGKALLTENGERYKLASNVQKTKLFYRSPDTHYIRKRTHFSWHQTPKQIELDI